MHREETKRLSYDEQLNILNMVETLVAQFPEMQTRVLERCTRGMQLRYDRVNEMRVDAETAVIMLMDLVPQAKKVSEKNQYAMTLAKRAVVRSGAYGGTGLANRLEQELSAEVARVP